MVPDGEAALRLERCPQCAAVLRPGALWCGVCFADLRPEPAPVPADEPVPGPTGVAAGPARLDPLTAPLSELDGFPDPGAPPAASPGEPESTWPCSRCGSPNPLGRDDCSACGAGFLDVLRDGRPLLELPGLGDVAALERGQRFLLAAGIVIVIVVLTVLLGLL